MSDYRNAVLGRQHLAGEAWRGGGLGYVAAPVEYVLSPLTGASDLVSSYYRGRAGTITPFDRQTTDITMFVASGRPGAPTGAVRASARTFDTVPAGQRLILRPVEIEFPASGLSPAQQRLFSAHLAEQQAGLNYLSLFRPSDLQLNLANFPNVSSELAAARALARSSMPGARQGWTRRIGSTPLRGDTCTTLRGSVIQFNVV